VAGQLIVVEGPEGSGKTTQAHFLAKSLKQAGIAAKLTREPGDTNVGNAIRRILLEAEDDLSFVTELFLFEASRAAWVDQIVKPAIAQGYTIVTDRSFISTLAYQGYAGDIALESVSFANSLAMQGIIPDLVMILDIDLEMMYKRMSYRELGMDRIESKNPDYHQKVIDGYRQIAASTDGVVLIDGSQSKIEVHTSIISVVNRELGCNLEISL
jgi:dTMP kinase